PQPTSVGLRYGRRGPHDAAFLGDLGVRPRQPGFPDLGPPLGRTPPRICLGRQPTSGQSPCPFGALAYPVASPLRVPPSREASAPAQECAPALHRLRQAASA